MLTNVTQSGLELESITTAVNTTSSQDSELTTESSINILYPLVGFFTIVVSAGLLAIGIRDWLFQLQFYPMQST